MAYVVSQSASQTIQQIITLAGKMLLTCTTERKDRVDLELVNNLIQSIPPTPTP